MPLSPISYAMKPLRALRRHGLLTFAVSTLLGLIIIIGLVYNAIAILRLPQTGLKPLEIIWVSVTACVVLMLVATAIAAGLESLGGRLRPKPPGEEWLRDEVRHGRIPGMSVPALATRARSLDMDRHKGAFEPEDPKEKGNTCIAGQLPHRGEDPLLKAFDSDFPEPGENAEHSGEPETVSLLDRGEGEASRRRG